MTESEWKPDCYTLTQLKERGWTPALIEQHLGPPDRIKRNPFSKKKPPMRLWLISRVEAAEASGVALRQKSETRSAAMRKSVQRRAAAMIAEIDAIPIEVPRMPPGKLLKQAIRHFNDRLRWGEEEATPGSDPEFLARIQVNYLRHVMTDYDALLDERAGEVGIRMGGHARIFRRVMDAISAEYPWLARACEQQYLWRFGTQEDSDDRERRAYDDE